MREAWTQSELHILLRSNTGPATPRSGKKKAHKHNIFGSVALGTTPGLSRGQSGFVPGTKTLCPRDKPRLSPCFTQWKLNLSQGQTRERRVAEKVYVLKFMCFFFSGHVRPRQGTEICTLGVPSSLDFLNQVLCAIYARHRPKMWRTSPDSRAEKRSRILSHIWLSWSFRSWFSRR